MSNVTKRVKDMYDAWQKSADRCIWISYVHIKKSTYATLVFSFAPLKLYVTRYIVNFPCRNQY